MPAEAKRHSEERRRTAEAAHGKVPTTVRARPSEKGLAQPLPVPRPLRAPARPAQPLEPILFPKLRI